MKRWSSIAAWGLVVLIALNSVGTVCYFLLRGQLQTARSAQTLAEGDRFPKFSGMDVRGTSWEPRTASCHVIRIAEDHCGYCKKDKPSYDRLLDAARRDSCEIIEIAPAADGMAYDPRPGVVQLKYVNADIGSVLFPFVTPQTIILDSNWSVKMTRRGVFNDESLASSVALLNTLSAPRVH